jgi:hypothetical protein
MAEASGVIELDDEVLQFIERKEAANHEEDKERPELKLHLS